MPSKGRPKSTVRIDDDLMKEMLAAIHRRNLNTQNPPWVLSDFIRAALREKLDHMDRSRNAKRVSDTPPPKVPVALPMPKAP